jgi:hypothetical protein
MRQPKTLHIYSSLLIIFIHTVPIYWLKRTFSKR